CDRGYGRDTIIEVNTSASNDTLLLGVGIVPSDLIIVRSGGDVVIRIKGTDDRITIQGQNSGWNPIETVVFSDGTHWTAAQLLSFAITPDAAEALLHPASNGDPFASSLFNGAPGGSGGGNTSGGDDWVDPGTGGGPSGTNANETIYGTSGNDTIYGLAGNDDLFGRDGDDLLDGGDGHDDIEGEGGDDTLIGGTGDDWLFDDQGNNVLYGGSGYDSLYAGAGDDFLYGGTEGDWLYGGAGNDYLSAGLGYDDLDGGDGDDILIGDNEADLAARPSLDPDGALAAYFGPLNRQLINTLGGPAGFGSDSLDSGESYRDIDIPADFLAAVGGQLMINGSPTTVLSLDERWFELGDFYMEPWWADIDTSFGAGAPSPGGTSQGTNRVWYAFDAATKTITITWDDVVQDWDGERRGPGNAFQVQIKVLDGGDLDVVLRFEDLQWDEGWSIAPYISVDNDVGGQLPWGGTAAMDTSPGNSGIDGVWVFQVRDGTVIGGDPNYSWEEDDLYGGAGNDRLEGGVGDDDLDGGTGNDTLFGGSGGDYMYGGDGDDVLEGESGDDDMDGGAGNDTLRGGDDNDWLYGYTGNDQLHGDAGNDYLYGQDGDDVVDGGAGEDLIYGDAGDDTLIGDTIDGTPVPVDPQQLADLATY